jgi:hypothetical protein
MINGGWWTVLRKSSRPLALNGDGRADRLVITGVR